MPFWVDNYSWQNEFNFYYYFANTELSNWYQKKYNENIVGYIISQ